MKRVIATLLWSYCGWTAGAFIDFVASGAGHPVGPALGPILGAAAGAIVAVDPRRLIWSNRAAAGHTEATANRVVRTHA